MRNGPGSRETALELLARGLWPVAIKPGGKAPIGDSWGVNRPTHQSITDTFRHHPKAGLGVLLGPEGTIIDIECDGPEGEVSLSHLLGSESAESLGWSSARGPHYLFRYSPRLVLVRKSIIKLPDLPDLEIRVGGNGKQLQSNCPPTIGTDGKPRRWNGCDTIAELPEAALAFLEDALAKARVERLAIAINPRLKNEASSRDAYARKALDDECRTVEKVPEGKRNATLNRSAFNMGQFVGAGALDRLTVEAALAAAARECGLPEGEAADTIRSGLEAGQNEPRDLSRLDSGLIEPTRRDASTGTDPPPGASVESPRFELATRLASAIRPVPVHFLDGGAIPRGKLITLAGLGGAGKGMLWANLAADLTRGRPTLGLSYEPPPPGDVLLIGCEDGYSDTVNPRLLAADADLNRVHILDGVRDVKGNILPFSLAHLKPLDAFLGNHPEVLLVVIDPITGYVGRAGIKDHHDAELRSLLEPLAELADRRGCTILTIKHLNKDEAKSVASRVGGSIAYVNVPRACFVVANDPENEARRILAPFKWNLNAPRPPSVGWAMEPPTADRVATILESCHYLSDSDKVKLATQLNRLVWLGKVDSLADDLLKTAARIERRASPDELGRASNWLRHRLTDGPVGSIICAREGDRAIGRSWPLPGDGLSPNEQKRRVMVRVKWWRENILKTLLDGESRRAGFQGPWFFCLAVHFEHGLWPPSPESIQAAQRADEEEVQDALGGDPSQKTEDGPPNESNGDNEATVRRGDSLVSSLRRSSTLLAHHDRDRAIETAY